MDHDKRIPRSQKEIYGAFLELIEKKGFEEITTTDIIVASGYSRGTFYAYFEDKYDLANKVLENEIHNFVDIIAGTIKRRKRIVIEPGVYEPVYQLFLHVNEHHRLYKLILESKIPGYTLDQFVVALNERFKKEVDVELNQWPDGFSKDFYTYVNTYTFIIYIKYWGMHDFELSVDYMAEQVTHMLNRGKAKYVFGKL